MSLPTVDTDVLVCGGGPVGLLTAYCLNRYGVSTIVVEQKTPNKEVQYGRAIMFMPRTLELLDQLDLLDPLGQIGFWCRGLQNYKNGERQGLVDVIPPSTDSFYNCTMTCRQRWTEKIIADAYLSKKWSDLRYGTKLLDTKVIQGTKDYNIRSTVVDHVGQQFQIRSNYIVGADGGHSKVRALAGIPFEGEASNRRWIRIDGVVETDMPEARYGVSNIHSATHGSVMFVCLDHNATRIGFALPERLNTTADNMSLDELILQVQEAVKPFTIKFKTVDWWTIYSVGQRLAASYRAERRIFLAGDAAHTHSSSAAQGLNTGCQDAVNLSWKLAGRVKGLYNDCVLDTYSSERRSIASQVIAQDKITTLLTEGKIPPELQQDAEKDPHKLLFKRHAENQALNTGLGIIYPVDNLTIVKPTAGLSLKVNVGGRAPDVQIQRPGARVPLRLYSQVKNNGKFTILVFCGDASKTKRLLMTWSDYLEGAGSVVRYGAAVIDVVSILVHNNYSGAAEENMGISRHGPIFYDNIKAAHDWYGIPDDTGAVLVLRPDGILGTACSLSEGSKLSAYFARFMASGTEENASDGVNGDLRSSMPMREIEVE